MNKAKRSLERATKLAGSRAALARIAGVSKQAAYKWKVIPAEHVLAIEAEFDGSITRYEMRPDVYGQKPVSAESVA